MKTYQWLTTLVLAACTTAVPDRSVQQDLSSIPAAWPHTTADATEAPSAMVVTDAPLATEVGVQVMRDGGNAVDAAVAVAFALAVVYPEAGNIGGGGFMVTRMADGTSAALDFREKAPLAAHRDMFLDDAGELTEASVRGHLASGVPGAVMGLWEAHRRLGTRPWAELVAPAIRLAEDGFTVDQELAASLRNYANLLRQFEGSAELFLSGGEPPAAGSRWRNPDLGRVLRRIAEDGPAGFYEGETADLIVAEMRRGGGIITHEDLRRYRAEWRTPVEFSYRGHHIISMPPASSGGITLAIIGNILDGYPLDRLGWHTDVTLHLMAEAMRRAFADRNHYLGDPAFVEFPQATLTSGAYAARLRETIDRDRATPSTDVLPGMVEQPEPTHTTHFSVVDPHGNAVALTTTINGLYGSGVTIRGAGIVMNNEMDDFAAKPGSPNMFGLVQGEANAIEPEKRMLSAMTPTIVLDPAGDVLMVTGARGGPRIITAVFQVISNVLDHGMDVATAVRAPRVHHQHLPDALFHESSGMGATRIGQLEAMGHTIQSRATVGTAPTILRRGSVWTAAPDPRTGGSAGGF
ncbi:MAG TPA: gamma-glutamyltransferase [Longimicrobiales bacterium]|nr:gamma-glutamyltransferase [Longimicrobiales bacterium]